MGETLGENRLKRKHAKMQVIDIRQYSSNLQNAEPWFPKRQIPVQVRVGSPAYIRFDLRTYPHSISPFLKRFHRIIGGKLGETLFLPFFRRQSKLVPSIGYFSTNLKQNFTASGGMIWQSVRHFQKK